MGAHTRGVVVVMVVMMVSVVDGVCYNLSPRTDKHCGRDIQLF